MYYTLNVSLGHLVMDLNHMLRPAKSPEKCTLQLLDQPADKLVSLFEQKTVKGWWPCTCEQNGEKIIAVSKTNTPRQRHTHRDSCSDGFVDSFGTGLDITKASFK